MIPSPENKVPSTVFQSLSANGTLLMLISVSLFAASNLLIKFAGDRLEAPIALITASRFIVGFLFAATLFRGAQRVRFKSLVTNPWLIARGLIGGIGVSLYNECIINLGPGRASIITSSYPIFATLFASMLIGERLKPKQLAYIILSFLGLVIMTGSKAFDSGFSYWDLVAMGVAVASGFVVVTIRKLHAAESTATIFISQCAYGLVFVAPQGVSTFELPTLFAFCVIILSSVLVIGGQIAMTHGYKSVTVTRGSSIHLLMPVFTALASIALFGERFSAVDGLGGALTLFSCYMIVRMK